MSTLNVDSESQVFKREPLSGADVRAPAINVVLIEGTEASKALVPVERSPLSLTRLSDVAWPMIDSVSGEPLEKSQANIDTFLQTLGVEVAFDAFTCTATILHGGRWERIDDDVLNTIYMLMHRSGFDPRKSFYVDAVRDLARRNAYHPVRDYLDSLQWDGVPRLDTWLTRYCNAEDTPLHRAFGRCHLMAAVQRVRQPGCQKDEMLVLQGPTGCGKSSTIRILAGEPWFNDSIKVGQVQKEVIELAEGSWLVEISELDGMNQRTAAQIKAMLSTRSDRARLAYAQFPTDRPRQFVCFGTTNESAYLRDETGNRRFWPVGVGACDLASLKHDRDQLWAEAVHRLNQGEGYQLPSELYSDAARVQADVAIESPWFERLETALEGKEGNVSTDDLFNFLGVKADRQNKYLAGQLRQCMERLGWKKAQRKRGGRNVHCYTNVEPGVSKWVSLFEVWGGSREVASGSGSLATL